MVCQVSEFVPGWPASFMFQLIVTVKVHMHLERALCVSFYGKQSTIVSICPKTPDSDSEIPHKAPQAPPQKIQSEVPSMSCIWTSLSATCPLAETCSGRNWALRRPAPLGPISILLAGLCQTFERALKVKPRSGFAASSRTPTTRQRLRRQSNQYQALGPESRLSCAQNHRSIHRSIQFSS